MTFRTLTDHCRDSHVFLFQTDRTRCRKASESKPKSIHVISSLIKPSVRNPDEPGDVSENLPLNDANSHRCSLCNRTFTAEIARDHHEAQHNRMRYRCPNPCGNTFFDWDLLVNHYEMKHEIDVKWHEKRRTFEIHSEGPVELNCHVCSRSFASERSLHCHLKRKMTYECKVQDCGHQYHEEEFLALQRHYETRAFHEQSRRSTGYVGANATSVAENSTCHKT